jgi:hypothetical protein
MRRPKFFSIDTALAVLARDCYVCGISDSITIVIPMRGSDGNSGCLAMRHRKH